MRLTAKSLVVALAAAGMVLGGCSDPPPKPPEKLKVGFVYITSTGDGGWTYAHDQGRKAVALKFPDTVETKYVENVPEKEADITAALDALVKDGFKLIFTTSFGFMDPTVNAAKRYPDVRFEHCSGYKRESNLATYFAREYQARYLTGIVAGKMVPAGAKLGYVAAMGIPEVVRGINAYTLGVRSVNPTATVHVEFTTTWLDMPRETAAAKKLLDAGAELMAQHQDSIATVEQAKAYGKYAIGYDTDMNSFAPDTVLTSAIFNWGPYYISRVQAMLDGKWESQDYWGGLETGSVALAPFNSKVPEDVKKLVGEVEAKMKAGSFDAFDAVDAPIKKQDGTEWIAKGQSMTDAEKLSSTTFVEGVVGKLP